MTTSMSVVILCISSIICLACFAQTLPSFETHFTGINNMILSRNNNTIIIRVLENNGSRARTTYIPDIIGTRIVSGSTASNDNNTSIINHPFKKTKSVKADQFQQSDLEQNASKKTKSNYKQIKIIKKKLVPLRNYKVDKDMINACYLNCSTNVKHQVSSETTIKNVRFRPRLKIKYALVIVQEGNKLSKADLVNVVCRILCHESTSSNRNLVRSNGIIGTPDTNLQQQYVIGGRFPKFLSLFTLINFPNTPCITKDGNGGICYHPLQCQNLGGKPGNSCAESYGVCCYIEQSCSDSTALNGTYFTGTNFTNVQHASIYICMFNIYKAHPNVRQFYIYFERFELAPPMNGNCAVDRFVVTGQNTNSIVPEICGINTGQYIYIDVDTTPGPVSLTVLSSGARGLPKNFKIRIFQLKEDNQLLSPNNCLQYYTSVVGVLESFNYQHLQNNLNTTSSYMNNLNYAICIRKEAGYCSITYSNIDSSGNEYPFQLVNVDYENTSTVPVNQAGIGILNCPDDYIIISGVRLCGERFNDASLESDFHKNYPVTDSTNGPFVVQIHTNGNITGRGFHLSYRQNRCPK